MTTAKPAMETKQKTEQATPGPWAVYPGNYRASFVVPEQDLSKKLGGADDLNEDLNEYAQEVCVIVDHHRHRPVEEQRANARLIAAAPELLAALQTAAPALGLLWDVAQSTGVHHHLPGVPRIIGDMKAAIAKATGEQA